MAAEVDHLGTLTSENDNQSALLNQQVLDTVENIRICGAVNSTRICQIEVLVSKSVHAGQKCSDLHILNSDSIADV